MKLLCTISMCLLSIATYCMDLEQLEPPREQHAPIAVTQWTGTVVNCIESRKTAKLQELLAHPPHLRRPHALNKKIFEEIETHRDEQLDALRSGCNMKKIWNKFRAVTIDLGLPLATFGIGLADGIISNQKVLIALSTIYFVLSLESALKQAYSHWTMKGYQDKVEEFDVWLQVLQGLERLEKKGEPTYEQSTIIQDTDKVE